MPADHRHYAKNLHSCLKSSASATAQHQCNPSPQPQPQGATLLQQICLSLYAVITMNRKQKRLQIVQYFLRVSQAQEEVQVVQNQLATHLRFNPALLFRKIAQGSSLTPEQFLHYIAKGTGVKDRELLGKYMKKHHFGVNIHLQEFAASLLPYTPNILRQATDKIQKQMETKYVDKTVEGLYLQLLEVQLANLAEVGLFQKQLCMDWLELKRFLLRDLREKARRVDALQDDECSIVTVRQWLELWIEVEEYKILNMMRWFGGNEEEHWQSYYHSNHTHVACTCPDSANRLKSAGSPEKSKLSKVKSQSNLHDSKSLLKSFLKYIETIVKSQRRLELLRESLRPYRKQVELLLHEITSKKTSWTRLGKIIAQIQQALKIDSAKVERLLRELEHSKVDNGFLFSLFAGGKKSSTKGKLSKDEIVSEVYQVLYTFCLSKATLKALSRDIYQGAHLIFRQLDEHRRGSLDQTDLRLILGESDIRFKQDDLTILMNHFGDGTAITESSLREVLQIQSRS